MTNCENTEQYPKSPSGDLGAINCHSYYSFKYGTMSPDELLQEISKSGFKSFALTDINSTSAVIDIIRRAREFEIHTAVGIDFRNSAQQQFIAIAKNNQGYREMNEFLSTYLHEKTKIPSNAPNFEHCFVIYPFQSKLRPLNSNEFIGIKSADLSHLPFSDWKNKNEKLVIMQSITFRNKRDYNLHRILRAIDNNTLLSKLPKEEQAVFEQELNITANELQQQFIDYPQLIENTNQLLQNSQVSFDFSNNKNKKLFSNSAEEDFQLLKKACYKGMAYRFPEPDNEVFDRLDKELKVIKELGYCTYFLINWDLVEYAQRQNYFYVGRGSGANSLVAYLLRITNVDPVELDLYFERFINPYRNSPPDFDIDFSWTDREDITRYLFEKYNNEHTALLGTYITFNHKSAFREVGKVFGLPDEEITKLQKTPDPNAADEYGKWVICYSKYIDGLPSHCSIHSSGIIITEQPISDYSATELLPKGFPSTQFDMQVAEDVCIYKFDILSQRGLGKIKDTVDLIEQNHNIKIDIHNTRRFMYDESVVHLLKRGQAIGCFYIESPAMRMLLTKLKAGDYKSLVAASSIIRPGVAKSGMMREYIIRFQNKQLREIARQSLPELYEILEETYGVMVYQEDVIKVAHYFADLSLDEADVLRRGMSWKFRQRNEFWKIRDKFFSNCYRKGYEEETIANIWKQVESFANYAFAKGHSASYAVESFQALYLKAYYPIEYMTATLNNGGGFYSPHLYIHEARLHGAIIEAPCINKSDYMNRVEGDQIYLGFYLLGEFEREIALAIIEERNKNGVYLDLPDFLKRITISVEQLSILIRINAFRFTGKHKKELLWDIHYRLNKKKVNHNKQTLFEPEVKTFELPELYEHKLDDAYDQLEILGFTLQSPFDLIASESITSILASDLRNKLNEYVSITSFLITRKPTRSSNGKLMFFGTWIDQKGQWIDTVHFPPSAAKYPFRGPGCYQIGGKVVEEYGFITIEVARMFRIDTLKPE